MCGNTQERWSQETRGADGGRPSCADGSEAVSRACCGTKISQGFIWVQTEQVCTRRSGDRERKMPGESLGHRSGSPVVFRYARPRACIGNAQETHRLPLDTSIR